ncbi:hypothetical protein L1049_020539 [Liquidambar formosana]|uniref:Uncharacterized protein n=1 Tax=Liquidambar formosana TaxID=63359 RepID=A0AAP0SD89_LIQFO
MIKDVEATYTTATSAPETTILRYDGEQPCNRGYISRVTSPNSEQVLGQGSNIVMDMQKNPSNCLETSLNNVVNKDSSFEAVVKDKQTAFTTFGADIGAISKFFK